MEIIRKAVRVGNSAGVLLPKKWLNATVKVVLEPLNIEKDVLEIIANEGLLKKTFGAYIVGSYARNEQNIDSDVDILVVTSGVNKKIVRGKYEIIFISKEEVQRQLNENALPVLAMIKEAKIITNEDLIKEYKNHPLTKKNLKYHVETTKSAMNVVNRYIKLAKEAGENVSDAATYSLILRLRTLYIIDCIRKKEQWSKREFLMLIKKISGSLNAYEIYLNVKSRNTLGYGLKREEAEKLMNYINKKIKDVEKWLKEKKD
ncbi:DUF2080 family transposase-associated protein [Candidatus Pacearchaeota archaeon]|nr:DUF2080 family transposase-associated protein [Candidatus Pacearchaeota archaeon]